MGLNYDLLRNLTTREIISALVRNGFAYDRGDGSHQIYCPPDGRRVTVVFHGSSGTFRRKTLKIQAFRRDLPPPIPLVYTKYLRSNAETYFSTE